MSGFVGVILAAGEGKRMAPLNAEFPKPLLPVGDMSLIRHQLRLFDDMGVKKCVVVVSESEKLKEHISKLNHSFDVTFIEQKDRFGIAHALSLVEDQVADPFLLFLGDIYLQFSDNESLKKAVSQDSCSYLIARKDGDLDAIRKNFAIIVDDDGCVKRVIEKPKHPPTNLKGCGLYFFTPEIFDAIRRTPKDQMRNEYELTTAIQVFLEDGYPVYPLEVVDWDINITFPRDL